MAVHGHKNALEHATHYCHDVIPAMAAVRKTADILEAMIADDLWPLPTYQEMLFIM
jgi:glutamine synthetase